MKRYLLFVGDYYYPHGGWSDYKGNFDHISEAANEGRLMTGRPSGEFDWFQVIDKETGKVVSADKSEI